MGGNSYYLAVGIVAYKLVVAMMLFIVIWLTLWARQLAKKEK